MVNRYFKIQLTCLFLVSLICLISFIFYDTLSDNMYQISSTNVFGTFSYYAASLLSFVKFYIGPWPFFGAVLGLVFFPIQLKRNLDWIDILGIYNGFALILSALYLFYAEFLGEFPRELLSHFSNSTIAGFSFLSAYLHGYIVFRDKFVNGNKKLIMSAYTQILNSSIFQKRDVVKIKEKNKFDVLKAKFNTFKESKLVLKSAIFSEKMTSSDMDNESAKIKDTFDEIEIVQPIVETKIEKKIDEATLKSGISTNVNKLPSSEKAVTDERYFELLSEIGKKDKNKRHSNPDDSYFSDIIGRIEDKLNEFKVEGKIINILKGPVVDTFELDLGPGVKVSKVRSISEDLGLALFGAPIRIVYPMKGRTTVGIEVPRNPRELIFLDEIIESKEYLNNVGSLPLAMGKDAFGQPFIVDLAAMPHMLVAGATGAGKSVFINTILVSLLIKKTPRQMKLVLIDPKQLELALYAKLPHLIMPVMIDAKMASLSLLWAVQEMERRYSILKEFGVRNIDGFNSKLKSASPELIAKIHHYFEDINHDEYELPYIVIVVDEFADLILTKSGKEIENNICRLAAKARAAGIHLILATQRPSVDVITGLIKANFPTRVSFRVTSAVDSRTILNEMGAEKLLGKGDMLYKHGVDTIRVHSSYVDENEIEQLTNRLSTLQAEYDEAALEFLENGGQADDAGSFNNGSPVNVGGDDDLYSEAVQIVSEHRMASASMLQRRLKVGYNRAANLIEEMEAKGIVGPAQGSKPRKVLTSASS